MSDRAKERDEVVALPVDPVSTLSRMHATELLRVACAFLGDRAAAEDAVQDAFLTSRERVAGLDPDDQVRYLRRAVLNACRMMKRRARAAKRQPTLVRAVTATVEEQVVTADRREKVRMALDRLPGRQRQCLVLRYYSELSDHEIASTLGISLGSVKTHLRRGLGALESAMEKHR